jgi:hypothetical protein
MKGRGRVSKTTLKIKWKGISKIIVPPPPCVNVERPAQRELLFNV